MKETVVVGMSGGVDSSVAAYLLKEQGYQVIGVTMQLFDNTEDDSCCGITGIEDARRVAAVLDIPYYVLNFKEVFRHSVMDYFAGEYGMGRTPNPCIVCNRYVKWEALLKKGREIGAEYLATGHYARVGKLSNGRYAVMNSVTAMKDQTYALYNLTQKQLAHTLMPVGEYDKERIREIARRQGLPVAVKPDSQDICFVPDHDYAGFVCRHTGKTCIPGNFVDSDGNILGQHKGIIHYTVGQRKGLGISFGKPMYVGAVRPDSNEVVLVEEQKLWTNSLCAKQMNYMGVASFVKGQQMLAKIRYSHKGELCQVEYADEHQVKITFEKPVRAVTPGQAVVFYDGEVVLGGGVIAGGDGC